MTVYFDQECEADFPFDQETLARKVIESVIETEEFPYEAEVNVMLVSKEEIKSINHEYRGIDNPTDVLSFPLVAYECPGDFSKLMQEDDNFNPDTGEAMLGDIILCADKIREQALEYGHSEMREFAFLIVHSMLHLFGYDHMTLPEAAVMEEKQRVILDGMQIVR